MFLRFLYGIHGDSRIGLKNLVLYHKEFEIFTNEFFIFIWLECGLCVFVG
ncbi:hypothetical protein [uncultured Helicobacter sp.]|nr:hypothetical protein [uncultured Helicobacter sp.]